MLELNKIYNLPCEIGLKQLDNESIDFVCIDPPYTDGNGTDVLKGHKIQTQLDILAITKEHYRVLKPNSFYAVFGQMPTILAWYNAAITIGLKFTQEIVWSKRVITMTRNFNRNHELIYIFKKGNANFYKLDAKYEDTTGADIYCGIKSIESLLRELSYWKGLVKGAKLKNKIIKQHSYNESQYDNYIGLESQTNGKENNKLCTVWSFLPENKINRNSNNTEHPTVKSIRLVERLIELCTPENTEIIVLDSFIGSGTTYLACQNTNRKCIGFEIAEEYYLLSKNRAAKNVNLFTV